MSSKITLPIAGVISCGNALLRVTTIQKEQSESDRLSEDRPHPTNQLALKVIVKGVQSEVQTKFKLIGSVILDYNTVEQENIPNCTCKIESNKSTYQVEIKIKLN